jgi:hypothetical protein
MQVILVYALAYVSAMGFLLMWRLSQFLTTQARQHIFSIFSKWILYTVVFLRMNGSSDVTVMACFLILLFITANIVGTFLGIQSQPELSLRLARMCLTNTAILFLSGRSNLLVDKVFRISITEYHLLHRWIGRITVIEGLTHGTLSILQARTTLGAVHLSVSLVQSELI